MHTRRGREAVTGAALEALESLVAKNLVLAEAGPDGNHRLTMLETVRAHARERLEQSRDAEVVRRRHCEYFLALAERTQPELERTASAALADELDRELDNMRAAFAWALAHAPALALRIASATAMYWYVTRLKSEAADWLAAALALPDEAVPVAVRAAALQHYAMNLATTKGTIEQAERAARESLELRRSLNDLSGCARSTWVLAQVLVWAHRMRDAYHHAGEALRLADVAGDRQARVWALGAMAMAAPTVHDALSIGEEAFAATRAAGNQRELATLQSSLAYTALIHGDHAAADRLSREALDAASAYGDPWVLALAEGKPGSRRCSTAKPARPSLRSQASCVWGSTTASTATTRRSCTRRSRAWRPSRPRTATIAARRRSSAPRRRDSRAPRCGHRAAPRAALLRSRACALGRASVARRMRRRRDAQPRSSG